jgi:transposase-like protein
VKDKKMNEKIEYQPISMDTMLFCKHRPEICIKYNSLLTKEAEDEYLNQYKIWAESDSGRQIIKDFNEEQTRLELKKHEDNALNGEKFSKVRYEICNSCENFNSFTKFCSECHCFMPVKVLFKNVKCPVDKWQEEK